MLRSERMTFASILCTKKDVETVLEALSNFGEFHLEEATNETNIGEQNEIIQIVEEALININEINRELIQEPTGFLDIFKTSMPIKVRITAENWQDLLESTNQQILTLKKEVDNLTAYLVGQQEKSGELNRIKGMLTITSEIGVDLTYIEESRLISINVASVPRKNVEPLQMALKGFPLIFHSCYLTKETDFICLAIPSKHLEDVQKILKIHHAQTFDLPVDLPRDTFEANRIIDYQLNESLKKEKEILSSIREVSKENSHKLSSWRETIENVSALTNAKRKILKSGRLATIKGFVPKKKLQALTQKAHAMLQGKVIVLENTLSETQDPPTKFSHNRFVKPFEEITKLYGLPHYEELDPTPIIALTFPILFGLMFGDLGHGLILLAGGLIVGKLVKKNQGVKNVCWIIAACGAAAAIAGLLFGEVFGKELFSPLWFDPFNNVLMFLVFSLFVGVIQIMSGMVIELTNFLLRRNVLDAVLTSVPKIAFYVGAVYLIAVYQLNFGLWFSGPILYVIVPFLVLVFAKPTFLAARRFSWTSIEIPSEQPSFGQRIFESGDMVTRLLSNTISYTRILALLMAHWALILVTYTIAGLVGSATLPYLILSGIIIVGGNIFVIAFETLIVFIHTLRLHFYEWFSKFFEGSGTEFKPFKQNFVYTELTLEKKES